MKHEDWLTEEVIKILEETKKIKVKEMGSKMGAISYGMRAAPKSSGSSIYNTPMEPGALEQEEEEHHQILIGLDKNKKIDEHEKEEDLLLGKKLSEEEDDAPPADSPAVRMGKAEKFVMVLPKYVPTEAWGDPNSMERKQVQKIFNTIGGAATVQDKLNFINATIANTEGRITGVRRILGVIILLESFAAVIRSFNEASAGFVFEGFMAALLRGKQQTARSEKGNLPIEDLLAFSELPGHEGEPISLKLLSNKTNVEGSYTNLVDALFQDYRKEGMLYIVARKDGEQIALEQFHLDADNFVEAIALDTSGELKASGKVLLARGKKSATSTLKALSAADTDAEKYALLKQTNGYTGKDKEPTSAETEKGEDDEIGISWADKDVAFVNPKRWGEEKFQRFFHEVESLPDDLYDAWQNHPRKMESTFLRLIRNLNKKLKVKDKDIPMGLEDYATREVQKWLDGASQKSNTLPPHSYLGGKERLNYLEKVAETPEEAQEKIINTTDPAALAKLFLDAVADKEAERSLTEYKRYPYTVEENQLLWESMKTERALLTENKGGGGTQWVISPSQLHQIRGVDYKVLGTLPYDSSAAAKTAEEYMDILYDDLYEFFSSAQSMSQNANGYFFTEKRDSGIAKGEEAIKNAGTASEELGRQITGEKTKSKKSK